MTTTQMKRFAYLTGTTAGILALLMMRGVIDFGQLMGIAIAVGIIVGIIV